MKKEELIEFKRNVEEEKQRRKRQNELLKNEDVIEILKLSGTDIKPLSEDIRDIIQDILDKYRYAKIRLTNTNNIYVLHGVFANWIEDCPIKYYADPRVCAKLYSNIDTGLVGYIPEKYDNSYRTSGIQFEKDNIVLLPPRALNNNRCVQFPRDEVDKIRLDFFEECVKYGESKGIKRILKENPRLYRN